MNGTKSMTLLLVTLAEKDPPMATMMLSSALGSKHGLVHSLNVQTYFEVLRDTQEKNHAGFYHQVCVSSR